MNRTFGLVAVVALWAVATSVTAQQGMRVQRDIPYGPEKEHRLDVYLPDPAPTNAPVILMVHGGAWAFGDKSNAQVVVNKSRRWVPKGVVFVSINNRLVPAANPVEQAEDVARAIAFVQKEAKGWGGDPANLVTMGHSAGAHLVALLAADPARAKRFGAEPWLGTVVLDSGALDVPQIMRNWHAKPFDTAFGGNPSFWKEASPRHALTAGALPMLVVCSSQRLVSCAQAKQFAFEGQRGKGKITVLEQDLNHREINETLGLDSDYTREVEAFMASVGLRLAPTPEKSH